MAQWELRPLSLGEVLDRTFSLYRRNFLLFFGIAAIPHLFILGLNLLQVLVARTPAKAGPPTLGASNGLLAFGAFGAIIALIVYVVAYLFMQGGTIFAVSDLYLGRPTFIGASLGRMWGQLLNLFGVSLLNGLAVFGLPGFMLIFGALTASMGLIVVGLLLTFPAVYIGCRLCTCVPAALLEDLGARESLERSWGLTKDFAGRAFLIILLYIVMLYALVFALAFPLGILIAMSANDPGMVRFYTVLVQFVEFLGGVLVGPFLLIATSVFYYDLRVRKEAFDLQMMMNPGGGNVPANDMAPRPLRM